jgi:hypothetical protein
LGELRSKIFLQKGLDAGSTNDSDLPVGQNHTGP